MKNRRPPKPSPKKQKEFKLPPALTSEEKRLPKNATWYLLLILLATFAAFIPALKNQFIETWDDAGFIIDNIFIKELNFTNLKAMFTQGVNSNYIPLIQLSFALEYKFFGLDPLPYHLDNILLHLLSTFFVFRLLLRLRVSLPWAVFGALFFGIQPMRVESVAWATERKDLLFAVFYLPALLAYNNYIQKPDKKWLHYSVVLLLFILSLLSKIQAVALPLTMLLLDYYWKRPLKINLIVEKIPFFALSLAFGILGYKILGQYGALEVNETFSFTDRLFFGLFSLTVYFLKFFFPYVQSALYPYPAEPGDPLPLLYYLNPVFLAALAFLVFKTYKKTRAVIFGTLFFFINIVFVLQIVAAGSGFMVDRYTYIPYFGLWFVMGWGLDQAVSKRKNLKFTFIICLSVLTLIYGVMTWNRSQAWKNTYTLWTDVIEKYPGKLPTAYANRASWFRKQKELDKALEDYNYSIRLDKRDGSARMNRGNIYFDQGIDSLAYADYQVALKLKLSKNFKQTEIYKLYSNLGAIYGRRAQYDSALYYLNLSLENDSNYTGGMLNRAVVYQVMGQFDKAIADFERYLRYEPNDDRVYSDIGVGYQSMGKFQESLPWFEKAIALNPEYGVYYLNASFSYNALKQTEQAREFAIKAQRLGAGVRPDYLASLGIK